MRRPLVVAFLCLLASACTRADRQELSDSADRYRRYSAVEVERLANAIERYARSNAIELEYIPLEVERFMEWRKRSWWRLNEAAATLYFHEWNKVEKLSRDVARFYGYNIQNFPRAADDINRFLHRAAPEWRNLVLDAAIFVETRRREVAPLIDELERAYEKVDWEVANLEIDIHRFMEWREREYERLIQDGRDFFALAEVEQQRFAEGFQRFRATAGDDARLLQADLGRFVRGFDDGVPRLIDGVWRFSRWGQREGAELIADGKRYLAAEQARFDALQREIARFNARHEEEFRQAKADIERFIEWYEREYQPLRAGFKRYIRSNVADGKLLIADLERFYRHAEEEAAELSLEIDRFFSYGSEEYADFKRALRYYFTDEYDPAYGGAVIPFRGDHTTTVHDDYRRPPPPEQFEGM